MWGLSSNSHIPYLYIYFFLILQISKHSTDIADHNRHSKSISLFENSGFQLEFESYPNVSCAHAVMQWIWFQVMYWFERSLSLSRSCSFFLSRVFSCNNKIQWNEQLHCKGELFETCYAVGQIEIAITSQDISRIPSKWTLLCWG